MNIFILPGITAVFFLIGLFFLIKNAGKLSLKISFLMGLMTGTGVAFSLIETVFLYAKSGTVIELSGVKLFIMILTMIMNSLNCLLKGILIDKEYKKDKPDQTALIAHMNLLDPLCLGALILVVVFFK